MPRVAAEILTGSACLMCAVVLWVNCLESTSAAGMYGIPAIGFTVGGAWLIQRAVRRPPGPL